MSTQQTLQNYFTTTRTSFIHSSFPDHKEAKLQNRLDNIEKKETAIILNQIPKDEKQVPTTTTTKPETVLSNVESKSLYNGPTSATRSNDGIAESIDLQLEFGSKKKKKRKKNSNDNQTSGNSYDKQTSGDTKTKKELNKSIPLWKYSKSNCTFCQNTPATILITGKLMGSDPKPLCLTHYYTTRSVLVTNINRIHVIPKLSSSPENNGSQNNTKTSNFETQLLSIQELFSQAFIELQKDVAEESARSFNQMKNSSDPLSILNDNRNHKLQRQRLRKRKLKAKQNIQTEDKEGGFIRYIALPDKMIQHEKKQKNLIQIQSELNDSQKKETNLKLNNAIETDKSKMEYNPYKRRKPKKKSYWDLNESSSSKSDPILSSSLSSANQINLSIVENSISCHNPKCNSQNIKKIQNNINMQHLCNDNNQAMTKGEIWGYKDRDNADINGSSTMFHCLDCGKVWREENDA